MGREKLLSRTFFENSVIRFQEADMAEVECLILAWVTDLYWPLSIPARLQGGPVKSKSVRVRGSSGLSTKEGLIL